MIKIMETQIQLQLGQKISRISLFFFSLIFFGCAFSPEVVPANVRFFSLALAALFYCVGSNKYALIAPSKSLQCKFMPPIPRALFLAFFQLLVLSAVMMLLDV
jgi:hypothetical protein